MTHRHAPRITLRIVIAHMQNMQQLLRSDMKELEQRLSAQMNNIEIRLSRRIGILNEKVDQRHVNLLGQIDMIDSRLVDIEVKEIPELKRAIRKR